MSPAEALGRIEKLLAGQGAEPPIEKWDPPVTGDIDIRIDREGQWWHEGAPIEREALVRLFASILRRENDGCYYLVTPVEKWRIRVEDAPLLIVDMEHDTANGSRRILLGTNHGRRYLLDRGHPLQVEQPASSEARPYVTLERGLHALIQRPVWYRLTELAEEENGEGRRRWYLRSGEERFLLGSE